MALGSGPRRTTPDQDFTLHLALAKVAIKQGRTRDQYLKTIKPSQQKKIGEFYDRALESLRKGGNV